MVEGVRDTGRIDPKRGGSTLKDKDHLLLLVDDHLRHAIFVADAGGQVDRALAGQANTGDLPGGVADETDDGNTIYLLSSRLPERFATRAN